MKIRPIVEICLTTGKHVKGFMSVRFTRDFGPKRYWYSLRDTRDVEFTNLSEASKKRLDIVINKMIETKEIKIHNVHIEAAYVEVWMDKEG